MGEGTGAGMGTRRRFDHLELGRRGEELAARWYLDAGCRVIACNWRCAAGELDIVAICGDTVVFCEVKARSSTRFGSPLEAVDRTRRTRIRNAAAEFLRTRRPGGHAVRFDVAAVVGGRAEVVREAF
ncbi:MAG: YraN family protein [Microthrixaceae bacterium]